MLIRFRGRPPSWRRIYQTVCHRSRFRHRQRHRRRRRRRRCRHSRLFRGVPRGISDGPSPSAPRHHRVFSLRPSSPPPPPPSPLPAAATDRLLVELTRTVRPSERRRGGDETKEQEESLLDRGAAEEAGETKQDRNVGGVRGSDATIWGVTNRGWLRGQSNRRDLRRQQVRRVLRG